MSFSATARPIDTPMALLPENEAAIEAEAAVAWMALVFVADTAMPSSPAVIVEAPSIVAAVLAAILFWTNTPPALKVVAPPETEAPTATDPATVKASMVWLEVAETATLLPFTLEFPMRALASSGVEAPGSSMLPA